MAQTYNPFENAQAQFDKVADMLNVKLDTPGKSFAAEIL